MVAQLKHACYRPVLHDDGGFFADRVDPVAPPGTTGPHGLYRFPRIVREFSVYERCSCLRVALPLVDIADRFCHLFESFHLRDGVGPGYKRGGGHYLA